MPAQKKHRRCSKLLVKPLKQWADATSPPKTSALVRAEYGTFDYDESTLDGDETHLFVGVDLDATARTSGRVMVGRATKHFDDPTRSEFSGTSWRAGVTWKPRSYSIFDLSTGRDADETNGFGDYILRQDITLGWAHNWNERFRTTVDGGFATEEHRPREREDALIDVLASLVERRARNLHGVRIVALGGDVAGADFLDVGAHSG